MVKTCPGCGKILHKGETWYMCNLHGGCGMRFTSEFLERTMPGSFMWAFQEMDKGEKVGLSTFEEGRHLYIDPMGLICSDCGRPAPMHKLFFLSHDWVIK